MDTRFRDVFQLSFEGGDKWDFHNEVKWSNPTCLDDDSAELVIGLDNMRPNSYSELRKLIMSNGGELINTVSMGGKLAAVVADMPHGIVYTFVSEVEIARLSSYIEPNVRFEIDFLPNDPDWSSNGDHALRRITLGTQRWAILLFLWRSSTPV